LIDLARAYAEARSRRIELRAPAVAGSVARADRPARAGLARGDVLVRGSRLAKLEIGRNAV
jgi:hypothetical protein